MIFPPLLNATDDTYKVDNAAAVSFSVVSWQFCYPRHYTPLHKSTISTKQIQPIVYIRAYQHSHPNNHFTMIAPSHRIRTLGIGSKIWANGQSLGVVTDIESVQKEYLTYHLRERKNSYTLTVHKSYWLVVVHFWGR